MPELAKLKDELSDSSFNIFGIFADDVGNVEAAKKFKQDAGLEITDILISETILPAIDKVGYVPYIYFVNDLGEVINVEKVGAQSLEELKILVDNAFALSE